MKLLNGAMLKLPHVLESDIRTLTNIPVYRKHSQFAIGVEKENDPEKIVSRHTYADAVRSGSVRVSDGFLSKKVTYSKRGDQQSSLIL